MQTFLILALDQLHCTIVFITHDIDEAIFLGTRLVVLSSRPGRVALDVPIELERPRTPQVAFEPHFLELKKQAMGVLRIESAGGAVIESADRPDRRRGLASAVGDCACSWIAIRTPQHADRSEPVRVGAEQIPRAVSKVESMTSAASNWLSCCCFVTSALPPLTK